MIDTLSATAVMLVIDTLSATAVMLVIGLGDVKLYAACCLFVTDDGFLSFLLLSALFGVLLALVYKFGKKQATFPFAPAIVLACFVVLLAESLGVL